MKVLTSIIVFNLLYLRCCKSDPLFEIIWYENDKYNENQTTTINLYTLPKTTSEILMKDIKKFPQLSGLNDLKSLSLSNSNISLPSGILENLPNLTYVNLVNNTKLRLNLRTFQRLNVEAIIIKNSTLTMLEDTTFVNLQKLERVDLSYNRLKRWNPAAFHKTPNIIELKLFSNKIELLQADAFKKFKKLSWLYLGDNKIKRFDIQAFRGLNVLSLLDLNSNLIKSLPENLFAPYSYLDTNIGWTMYRKKKYKIIDLQSNYLTFLPSKLLDDLSEVNEIDIQLNPWKCACYFNIMTWAGLNNITVTVNSFNSPICIVSERSCVEEINYGLLKQFFNFCDFCSDSSWPKAY